jgi:hypothetical protein
VPAPHPEDAPGRQPARPGARPALFIIMMFAGLTLADPAAVGQLSGRTLRVVARHPAPEATQAVAVDARFFYAIASAAIGKYEKGSGRRVAGWSGSGGRVAHLNSGIVIDDRLYCAHSNYPETPMRSSVEVFDTRTMSHLRTIPLPHGRGSATWVERSGAHWWVAFAHYAGRGGEPGKGPEATTLVRFDLRWRPERIWSFPAAVVARWDGMSSSGGTWWDGLLYTTGHHAPEIYVLALDPHARSLELREILGTESEGQGIAIDRESRMVYSIQRKTREVIVSELPGTSGSGPPTSSFRSRLAAPSFPPVSSGSDGDW